jgi:hypothetical protein
MRLVAIAALVMFVAGCGSTVHGTAEPGGPTVDSKKFSSVKSLLAEAKKGGAKCEPYEESSSKPDLATEQGLCGDQPDQVVVALYESKDDVKTQVDSLTGLLKDLGTDYVILYGPNWTANCDKPERCLDMQNAIGGRIEHTKKK